VRAVRHAAVLLVRPVDRREPVEVGRPRTGRGWQIACDYCMSLSPDRCGACGDAHPKEQWCYRAVDEAKRALFGDEGVKNPDFVLYPRWGANLVVELLQHVLGGEVVMECEPSVIALANSWIIIKVGGGPTEDTPSVTLEAPTNVDTVSAFLNMRVADIHACYEAWKARGANFLTPPMDRGVEIRCYMRDPDGHLIEVGQAKFTENQKETP